MTSLIIEKAINSSASDIHISCNAKPALRIDGELKILDDFEYIDMKFINDLVTELFNKDGKIIDENLLNSKKDQDFSFNYKEYRLRVNVFKQRGNLSLAIRIIPKRIPKLKELKLPKVVNKFKDYRNGLILITGTSGSGKSTTLASILDDINKNESKNIITLENPIEYVHENKKSIINQREIGEDVESFRIGIKSVMRQDPDVLVVGELRDLESISSAVTLAETGHLVFGTVHSKSVVETITRIIDVFPAKRQNQIRIQFANSIKVIMSQELIKLNSGGRIVNCEIMIVDDVIRGLISKDVNMSIIEDNIFMDPKNLGSIKREQSLAKLVNNGILDATKALEIVDDREKLKRLLIF